MKKKNLSQLLNCNAVVKNKSAKSRSNKIKSAKFKTSVGKARHMFSPWLCSKWWWVLFTKVLETAWESSWREHFQTSQMQSKTQSLGLVETRQREGQDSDWPLSTPKQAMPLQDVQVGDPEQAKKLGWRHVGWETSNSVCRDKSWARRAVLWSWQEASSRGATQQTPLGWTAWALTPSWGEAAVLFTTDSSSWTWYSRSRFHNKHLSTYFSQIMF